MTYSQKIRRRRRRRSLILWGLAVVSIATAFLVARAAGERELTRVYLDLAFDIANTEQKAALAFSSMIENVEDFDRGALINLLDQLEQDTADLVDQLDGADPPESLKDGHLFLMIATATWRSGLSDARLGLVALTDDVLDESGMATLARGLMDLRVGDSAFAGFLLALTGVNTELQGGDPPVVSYVPAAQEGLFDAQELARRLFLTTDLGPVSNIAVADLRLNPASVGEQQGLPVLAVTPNQTAQVTIANRGNIPAVDLAVQLSVISNDGVLWEAIQAVPLLEGDGLATFTFSNLPVNPGTTYEIIATSLFEDDENEDNSFSMLFLVNSED